MFKLKKKKTIIIAILIILGLSVSLATVKAMKSKESNGIPVKTTVIQRRDIESNIFTSGTVVSKETREISCDLSGKIDEVLVKEGDRVKKGEILAKVNSSSLEYEVKQAELNLEIAKTKIENLRIEDRDNLEISFKNAEIKYNDALRDYENKKALFQSGAISQMDLNAAKSTMETTSNQYFLAKKNLETLENQSEIVIQEKELKTAELELEKYKSDLEKTNIKSPINGTITSVNISELSIIGPSTILFVVQDTENLEIVTNISEYDINKVSLGQKVKVTGEGVGDKEYEGIVEYISPNAITTRNGQSTETTVEVKVGIKDKNTEFKPNFSANVEVNTASKKDILVVPYEAIYSSKEGRKIIYTVEDSKAKENIITTGIEGDLVVEIIGKDLKEEQTVILNPTEAIKDGIELNASKEMK